MERRRYVTPRYAWAVAAGIFIDQMVLVFSLKILAINYASIAAEWQCSVANLAAMASFEGVGFGLFGVLWGYLSDKKGSRIAIGVAVIMSSISMIAFGLFVNSIVIGCVFMLFIGIAAAGSDTATIPKIGSAWFYPSRRGIALSVFTVGGAVGGVLAGLIAGQLTQNIGWRASYVVCGCICLVLAFAVTALVRNSPLEMGTTPYGIAPEDSETTGIAPGKDSSQGEQERPDHPEDERRSLLKEVLHDSTTYKYSVVMILWYCWYMTYASYLAAAIQASGFDAAAAGLGLSICSIGCAIGSFIWSPLTDRFGRKPLFVILMVGVAVMGLVVMGILNAGLQNVFLLYGAIFIMGLFVASTPVMENSIAENYPPRVRGTGPGVVSTISSIGRFFGPVLAGMTMTALGGVSSYMFFSSGAALLCSIAIVAFVRPTGGPYGDPLAKSEMP